MKTWICRSCGHEVSSDFKPIQLEWNDGHICHDWNEIEPSGSELYADQWDAQLIDGGKNGKIRKIC